MAVLRNRIALIGRNRLEAETLPGILISRAVDHRLAKGK
jgi:hypothetical protein